MSKDNKIFLNSGARPFTLPSGDEGLYVDICLEDLEKILEEHGDSEIKRPWIKKSEGKTYNNIRIFAIPKKDNGKDQLYPYYLEVARADQKKDKNE